MTRRMVLLVAALAGATSPLAAKTLAYEDNKINFKSCSGENVTARWFGTDLSISRPGKSPGDPAPSAEYLTWDGTCASFRWDVRGGHFVVTRGDTTRDAEMISYIAWDDALWAATRTGGGFNHARVAAKGDPDPKALMRAAGAWLAKQPNTPPAAGHLAEALAKNAEK